jgi:hypothetical protein
VTRTATEFFTVQREPFAEVRSSILALLDRVPALRIEPARCEWLYDQNPSGKAALWTLRRGVDLVGYTVAVPRPIAVDGDILRGWIGADFVIDPACRTLGPALKLRKAAREAIDSGEADILYSFPNERMAAIHGRVGHWELGHLQRLVLPLRTGAEVRRRIPNSRWADAIAAAGDLALWLRHYARRRAPRTTVSWSAEPGLDSRFDDLFAEATAQHRIVGWRGSAYLQWRFKNSPHYQTQLATAASGGRLVGYLVLSQDGAAAHIRDLFVAGGPEVVQDLVFAAARAARRAGAASIALHLMNAGASYAGLRGLGFIARDPSDRVFVYARPGTLAAKVRQPQHWHLLSGDRDV